MKKYNHLPDLDPSETMTVEQMWQLCRTGRGNELRASQRQGLAEGRLDTIEDWPDAEEEKKFWGKVLIDATNELANKPAGTKPKPTSSHATNSQESADNSRLIEALRAENGTLRDRCEQLKKEVSSTSSVLQRTINELKTRINTLLDGTELKSALAAAASARTEATAARAEVTQANKNIDRLEGLCGLRGINSDAIVRGMIAPREDVRSQYEVLVQGEEVGAVPKGSAFAFYQKHRAQLGGSKPQHPAPAPQVEKSFGVKIARND